MIYTVTDQDFNEPIKELVNPKIRYASRGIIKRADGKIALFHKKAMHQYKLPGGGIEKNETKEQAFVREMYEETGCDVEIIKELGMIEEKKTKNNFYQLSYVFIAKVLNDINKLSLTDKEKAEGGEILWMEPYEALKIITECMDNLLPSPVDKDESLYSIKFITMRDMKILEYYIQNEGVRL